MSSNTRKALVTELLRHGKRISPNSALKVSRTLERIDQLSAKRHISVYNALLEVSLFQKSVGSAEEFLKELEAQELAPNTETIILLYNTFKIKEWKDGSALRFGEETLRRFGMKKNVRIVEFECTTLGSLGMHQACLKSFKSVPKAAQNRKCWEGLIESFARAGDSQEAIALTKSMTREGHAPSTRICTEVLKASTNANEVESVVALMKEFNVPPSTDTIDALESVLHIKD